MLGSLSLYCPKVWLLQVSLVEKGVQIWSTPTVPALQVTAIVLLSLQLLHCLAACVCTLHDLVTLVCSLFAVARRVTSDLKRCNMFKNVRCVKLKQLKGTLLQAKHAEEFLKHAFQGSILVVEHFGPVPDSVPGSGSSFC